MTASFAGWIPIHVFRGEHEPLVLWSHLGERRFDDPFFVQTVDRALQRPLARLLQRVTSLDELITAAQDVPAVDPAGFIFHVSRCGSTLVSQMFARLPRLIVIAEAQPLNAIALDERLSPERRAETFRALVRLYSRKVSGLETAAIFKFEPRDLFVWRQIAEIFPGVPRVILHRDPHEVLVSNFAQPATTSLPGNISAALLGSPPREIATNEDYAAFVFSRIFACAAEAAHAHGSLTVDYTELPDAVDACIAQHFQIVLSDHERETMRAASSLYAKDVSRRTAFASDLAAKQQAITPAIRDWVKNDFQPAYDELRARSKI